MEYSWRRVLGSRYDQIVSPVSGSMATTWRRGPATVYSIPSMYVGVERPLAALKLAPSHTHASSRSTKLSALISSAGEYRVCAESPPIKCHSPPWVPGACASVLAPASSPVARTAIIGDTTAADAAIAFLIVFPLSLFVLSANLGLAATSAVNQFSSRGKRLAMSSPVKFPTQPSGSLNSRIAVKVGLGPMSNQCLVLAGTEIRSSFSHSTEYTFSFA